MQISHHFLLPTESNELTLFTGRPGQPLLRSVLARVDDGSVDDVPGPWRCVFCDRHSLAPNDHGMCLGGVDWCECPCGTGEYADPLAVPDQRA